MLDLFLPSWAADVVPCDIARFRFPVAASARMVERRLCMVIDRRLAGGGNQTELSIPGSPLSADLGIKRSKGVQFR